MKKEIVPINTQIVLFFKTTMEYNTIKLANSINEKLPELGQPNIFSIPNDVPTEIKIQAPRILFNSTRDINITITTTKLDIFFNNNVIDKENFIKNIYESLLENNLTIQAIGIVYNYISNNIKIEKLQNYFNDKEIKESDLLNFSWHKKSESLNIWKNIETQENGEILNLRYTIDINNLGNNNDMLIDEIIGIIKKSVTITNEAVEKISEELGE